jgi:hypothetical protein
MQVLFWLGGERQCPYDSTVRRLFLLSFRGVRERERLRKRLCCGRTVLAQLKADFEAAMEYRARLEGEEECAQRIEHKTHSRGSEVAKVVWFECSLSQTVGEDARQEATHEMLTAQAEPAHRGEMRRGGGRDGRTVGEREREGRGDEGGMRDVLGSVSVTHCRKDKRGREREGESER